MNRAYLRLVCTTYGLSETMHQSILKQLDLFLSNNSLIFAAVLRLYLAFAAAAIFLLGEKLSLTLLSKFPVFNSFHNLILTVVLMAYYDADNTRG